MFSMPIVFDMSRDLRMVKMSAMQHETSQRIDGNGVDEGKLNDCTITDFVDNKACGPFAYK